MAYFAKGATCKACKDYSYVSPSKRVNIGVDASGLCEACRAFNAGGHTCPDCGGNVTAGQKVLGYVGGNLRHKVCAA